MAEITIEENVDVLECIKFPSFHSRHAVAELELQTRDIRYVNSFNVKYLMENKY